MARPTELEREEIRQRRRRLIALRKAGIDWQTIADELGYTSRGAACQDWRRAREQSRAELEVSVDELRSLELERHDTMLAAIWNRVRQGDVRAIEVALKISAQRAKLLGLDAPIQHEVITIDAVDRQIAQLKEELAHQDALRPPGAELAGVLDDGDPHP